MQSPSSNNTLYNKPYLGQLLSLLKMDKDYFKAEGNYLFAQDNGQVKKVLDLAGGYGSLLLGHNHPQLKDLMKELVDENSCQHHQLSKKSKANSLGSEINRLIHAETGCNYHSIILNTGAEAVEAALKHSLLAYDKKLRTIQETIDKNLLTIGESVFQNNRTAVLSFEGNEFNSISDLQSFINAFNNPYLNNYKPVILVTNKSFHGKTMGALSVTSNSYFREPFLKHSPIQSIHLDFNSDDQNELFTAQEFEVLIPQVSNSGSLTIKRKTLSRIAATIIEPVIGEGGVYVLKKEFLKRLRELTLKYKVPLIFDEVQSGCFRTGTFLASFQQGVKADYYILGKSLGGGISKISAVMIDQSYYIPEFDLIHSSTFAEDDLSCAIASRALKLMNDNKNRVIKAGDHLLSELSTLKNKYPDVIKDVRGLGLMIGINFQDFDQSRNYGLQGISRSKFFGYVLTAYLLNTKDIRVSVTMSDCRTIRILPSMFITREERDRFIFAMYELCKILEYGDFYSLISFLLPNDYRNLRPISNFNRGKIPLDPIEDCVDEVGFLLHYIDINTVRKYLNSLDLLPDEVIFNLIKTLKPFSEPVIIGRNRILNRQGKAVCITFMGLSFTSKMVIDDLRKSVGNLIPYQKLCNKAIQIFKDQGIKKIGLGQYNSIIMQNGKAVSCPDVRVTTGNGFTVHTAVEAVKDFINQQSSPSLTLGIVGGGGNIAKVLSIMLAKEVDQLHIIGRSGGNANKLIRHAGLLIDHIRHELKKGAMPLQDIYNQVLKLDKYSEKFTSEELNPEEIWMAFKKIFGSETKITIGNDLNMLANCDIVLVATNDPAPFLKKEYFKNGAFICDISVPLNCDTDLLNDLNYTVCKGGILNLPQAESLYPLGLGLDSGQLYACMAETILMGFENENLTYSYGEIKEDLVRELGNRVLSQGFKQSFRIKKISCEIN